ncbi:hypothetical protein ACFQE1_19890 [Halobium palmae]|uniref:Uncharacterized protein n=1 Tax=Halobium palmae TaxID=1776492 RepID=A0ABD5S4U2_9EURY
MTRPDSETLQAITDDLRAVTDELTGEAGGQGTFHYRVTGDDETHERALEVFEEHDLDVDVQGDGEERSYYLADDAD